MIAQLLDLISMSARPITKGQMTGQPYPAHGATASRVKYPIGYSLM